ncbi:MAG: hypothetical protein Q7V57_17670 [Actinomycetota bacterium]|nr:hypothetical protein [Actinomycetota bacterium]
MIVSAIIAICIVGMFMALDAAVTGTEGDKLPEAIERIDPSRSATQTPAQTQVFVDLQSGYTGVLIIDGLELETVDLDALRGETKPGQQIKLPPTTVYEPGNATLSFGPTEGSSIEEFSQGEHLVQVVYWKVTEGRGKARSFTWTFSVF